MSRRRRPLVDRLADLLGTDRDTAQEVIDELANLLRASAAKTRRETDDDDDEPDDDF